MCLNLLYTNFVEVKLKATVVNLTKNTPCIVAGTSSSLLLFFKSLCSFASNIISLASDLDPVNMVSSTQASSTNPSPSSRKPLLKHLGSPKSHLPRVTVTMCAHCNRVRRPRKETDRFSSPSIRTSDDELQFFTWISLSDFLDGRSPDSVSLKVSHGICSDCYSRQSEELDGSIDSFVRTSISRPSAPSSPLRHTSSPSSSPFQSPLVPRLPLHPQKVLVVDDNQLQRKILRRMVQRGGFECDVASNGHEALELARENDYALVLMDCLMGDTDGWSTSIKIRALEEAKWLQHSPGADSRKHGKLRIVAVTGLDAGDDLRAKCAQAGMDEVFQKPLSESKMQTLLAKVLDSGEPIK